MTDTNTTPTEHEDAVQEPQDVPQEPEDSSPNREAARYRRRLRETEQAHLDAEATWKAERDQLVAQRDALRKAEVDRIATEHGVKPALVWAAGTTLDDLVDDGGTVDREKVTSTLDTVRKEFLPPPRLAPSLNGAGRMGEPIAGDDDAPSWSSIIKGHGDS